MRASASTRPLNAGDTATFRELLSVFGDAFDDPATCNSRQPDDAYVERLLSSENFVAIAAFDGPKVIGGLAGYILPKFEEARSEFYIYDLAVHEDYRRQGVATALIDHLKTLVAGRGVYVIFVQAGYRDDAAVALYTKLGIRKDVIHFDIKPCSVG